ncbi:MAG: DNA alkylation repair protein, partial [Flavobacteriales bacterium]|nr:DNA alkylation repair protein [Flavobacteriales bacterium]
MTARNDKDVKAVLAELERLGSKRVREDMSKRFGIHTDKAWGVMMRDMQQVAKAIGTDHPLAQQLWRTGWYEARMVATMIADPMQVTPKEMDAWCNDFDNWGICDTVCFKLWDQVPHAWDKVAVWAKSEREFVKRAAFTLLACL